MTRKKIEEAVEIVDVDYDNPWTFKGEIFNSSKIGKAHGMIYLIEEISTGRVYVGQKMLWTKKTKTIDKKKKKREEMKVSQELKEHQQGGRAEDMTSTYL